MKSTYSLDGLEVDNLLGFLALLGLLRALDTARPQWFARAFFDGVPLRAHLCLMEDVSRDEIAIAASEGGTKLAPCFVFGSEKDIKFDGEVARRFLLECNSNELASNVRSAMCSDAAVRRNNEIHPTPLCAIFGQGHQHFLPRLQSVSAGTIPTAQRGKRGIVDLNDPVYIFRTLFLPWTRSDATESFRWDYEEDRRYALRYANPSSEPGMTQHGANRLALLGMISFQSMPKPRRGAVDLATRAASRGRRDRRIRITWPVWSRPATLGAIEAMLDDGELAQDEPRVERLSRRGIFQVYRVYRIKNGKFISFSRAEAVRRHHHEPRS